MPTNVVSNTCNLFCRSSICQHIKYVVVTGIVGVLIAVIIVGVSLEYCILKLPPYGNFPLLIAAITLLAYCEALHYGVVSIEKWDMNKYKDKFPRAYNCWKLVDTPEKVKKFLVGRQFFTIFVVFLISEITSFPGIPKNFAGMPSILVAILVQTGLPGVALTLTFGQLIGQIYVEEFTLPFLNLYGCNFVIRLALGAEYIGVCNFSWLLYFTTSRTVCRRVLQAKKTMHTSDRMDTGYTTYATDAKEEDRDNNHRRQLYPHNNNNNEVEIEAMSPTEKIRGPNFDLGIPDKPLNWFDYIKYFWSTCVTLGSLAIVVYGIKSGYYVLPVPPAAAFCVAVVGICILFVLEGLMIAIVETQYWDREDFKDYYPNAYWLHTIINQPDNVKRFIIGRQFCTVLTNFLLAQVFTFAGWKNTGLNDVIFFIGVKSGLVGVFITLAFGQLMPELLAAEFPLRFMNMWPSLIVGYVSLIFDAIGVGHAGWTIYYVTRRLCCKNHMNLEEKIESETVDSESEKPKLVRVNSAEILAMSIKNKENKQNVV